MHTQKWLYSWASELLQRCSLEGRQLWYGGQQCTTSHHEGATASILGICTDRAFASAAAYSMPVRLSAFSRLRR